MVNPSTVERADHLHGLGSALALIVVLDQGRLRDTGAHHELLERDDLYRESITALRIHH